MADLKEKIISLARRTGVLRARDLEPLALPRRLLSELTASGVLLRTGRGLYTLADANASEHRSLAEAAARLPRGVVCLLSALRFHGITTQNPWEVWMAIRPDARKPSAGNPTLRIVRFSGAPFSEGVEEHQVDGVKVKVYSVAKTVADCFRYRNKIGTDVAIEALRDGWEKRRFTADELWHFASVCRVSNVIRPFAESIIA